MSSLIYLVIYSCTVYFTVRLLIFKKKNANHSIYKSLFFRHMSMKQENRLTFAHSFLIIIGFKGFKKKEKRWNQI